MKNKYLSHSKISEKKYRQILRLFCDDLTAVQIAQSTGLGQQSRQPAFNGSQAADCGHCEASSPLCGEVEIDESYFGPRRVRGKKGRGAGKKIVVFGVLKRRSKVDTQNASRAALKQVIEARTQPFIPTAGGLTTASSIGVIRNTTGLITAPMNSRRGASTSTASRAFGVSPRSGWLPSAA